jgi:hypothetical protein
MDIVRRVADHVAAGYFPADDGVSMIARQAGSNAALLREVRTQLSEDPDTLPVCLSLLDRAARWPTGHRGLSTSTGPTRAGCTAVTEDSDPVAMTAPGGWRVVPITLERAGRTLQLYRGR